MTGDLYYSQTLCYADMNGPMPQQLRSSSEVHPIFELTFNVEIHDNPPLLDLDTNCDAIVCARTTSSESASGRVPLANPSPSPSTSSTTVNKKFFSIFNRQQKSAVIEISESVCLEEEEESPFLSGLCNPDKPADLAPTIVIDWVITTVSMSINLLVSCTKISFRVLFVVFQGVLITSPRKKTIVLMK